MNHKKNSRTLELNEIKESILYLLLEAWKYRYSYFYIYFIDILCRSVQPFINLLFPKYIIDELLGRRDVDKIVFFIVCMIVCNLVFNLILAYTKENIDQNYNNDFSKYFEAKLGLKIMQMDFENTENTEMLDKAEKAKTGMSFYSGGIGGITSALSSIITSTIIIIGVVGVLFFYSPLLLIIIAFIVFLNYNLNGKINKIQLKYFKDLSILNRAFTYILTQLSHFEYGKDIRLYAADKMMLTKADKYNMDTIRIYMNQSKETLKYIEISRIYMALQDGISYLYLAYLVMCKFISIGTFSMLIVTSSTFGIEINNIIMKIQDLLKKGSYLNEYVKFIKIPERQYNRNKVCDLKIKHTIEFRNVYFAYPGSEKYTLEDISIKIKAGEHLSIVGLNGAGKTTFIKLICRLYQVSSGEILLDGCNIQEYNIEEYIKLISVVFQDFKLVSFSLKENIVLDNAAEVDNKDMDELLLKVGLMQMVKSLPKGLDTPVFKYYDKEGVEPSGGEQQKLAIARALYKDASIVILDEPTAALDPIAEYEIYTQFNQLVEGKTAIYISHRLSSCKFCDKIAVFAKGKIKEYGTHEELIQIKNGLYSEMFNAQAQYYI